MNLPWLRVQGRALRSTIDYYQQITITIVVTAIVADFGNCFYLGMFDGFIGSHHCKSLAAPTKAIISFRLRCLIHLRMSWFQLSWYDYDLVCLKALVFVAYFATVVGCKIDFRIRQGIPHL